MCIVTGNLLSRVVSSPWEKMAFFFELGPYMCSTLMLDFPVVGLCETLATRGDLSVCHFSLLSWGKTQWAHACALRIQALGAFSGHIFF